MSLKFAIVVIDTAKGTVTGEITTFPERIGEMEDRLEDGQILHVIDIE